MCNARIADWCIYLSFKVSCDQDARKKLKSPGTETALNFPLTHSNTANSNEVISTVDETYVTMEPLTSSFPSPSSSAGFFDACSTTFVLSTTVDVLLTTVDGLLTTVDGLLSNVDVLSITADVFITVDAISTAVDVVLITDVSAVGEEEVTEELSDGCEVE